MCELFGFLSRGVEANYFCSSHNSILEHHLAKKKNFCYLIDKYVLPQVFVFQIITYKN